MMMMMIRAVKFWSSLVQHWYKSAIHRYWNSFIIVIDETMMQYFQWFNAVMIKMLVSTASERYIFYCVLLFVVVLCQVCQMLHCPRPNQAGEEKNHCEKENFEPHLQRNSQGKIRNILLLLFGCFLVCFLLHCPFILPSLRLIWKCWKLRLWTYRCGTMTLLGEMLSWERWTWICHSGTSTTHRFMNMHWRPG